MKYSAIIFIVGFIFTLAFHSGGSFVFNTPRPIYFGDIAHVWCYGVGTIVLALTGVFSWNILLLTLGMLHFINWKISNILWSKSFFYYILNTFGFTLDALNCMILKNICISFITLTLYISYIQIYTIVYEEKPKYSINFFVSACSFAILALCGIASIYGYSKIPTMGYINKLL